MLNFFKKKRQEKLNKLLKENEEAILQKTHLEFRERNNQIVNEIQTFSKKISNNKLGMEKIRSYSENILACTQESTSSLQEILAQQEETKNSSEQIATLAIKNAQTAENIKIESSKVVNVNLEIKDETTNVFSEAKTKLEDTLKKSKDINNIMKMVSDMNEIASQTNLLSINASIEAAKAGDEGKGFAVVAEQIGKLATQSSDIARDIQTVVQGVIGSVEDLSNISMQTLNTTENLINKTTDQMSLIGDKYRENGVVVSDLANDLELKISSITNSLAIVNTTLNTIVNVTSDTVEESTKICDNINEFNYKLDSDIDELNVYMSKLNN